MDCMPREFRRGCEAGLVREANLLFLHGYLTIYRYIGILFFFGVVAREVNVFEAAS